MSTLGVFKEHFGDSYSCFAREDYCRDTNDLASELVGKYFAFNSRVVRITETEAYRGSEDPASHAFRGKSKRNESMFGPAGCLYIYLSYGIHRCVNIVAGDLGEPSGILIRSFGPFISEPVVAEKLKRAGFTPMSVASIGPGRLGKALEVELEDDGLDLCSANSKAFIFYKIDEPVFDPLTKSDAVPEVKCFPRVGISKGTELPWRYVDINAHFTKKQLVTTIPS